MSHDKETNQSLETDPQLTDMRTTGQGHKKSYYDSIPYAQN